MGIYQTNSNRLCHGAIYTLPIFWLPNPLWIARHIDERSRQAEIYRENDLHDAFSCAKQENIEFVIAQAKKRPVVVLSPDSVIRDATTEPDLLIAPLYSIAPDKLDFLNKLKAHLFEHLLYLPPDPDHPNMNEGFINFQKATNINRKRFVNERSIVRLDPKFLEIVLAKFIQYLQIK